MFSFSRILSFCYILLLSLSTIYARPNPQVPTRRRTAARGILSPILGVTEKTFDQQVKDTIQQDVQATIDQFKNVPESIQKIIQQAIRLPRELVRMLVRCTGLLIARSVTADLQLELDRATEQSGYPD